MTSLSEGEVPHSPGDAQLYAARMSKAVLMDWESTRRMNSTMETFTDLKNSPDTAISDLSITAEDTQVITYYYFVD